MKHVRQLTTAADIVRVGTVHRAIGSIPGCKANNETIEQGWWRCPGVAFNWSAQEPTGPSWIDLRQFA